MCTLPASGHVLNYFHAGRAKPFSCFTRCPAPLFCCLCSPSSLCHPAVSPPVPGWAGRHQPVLPPKPFSTCWAAGTRTSPRREQAAQWAAVSVPGPRHPEAGCRDHNPHSKEPPRYFLSTKTVQSNREHTCLWLQLKKMRPYITNCLCIIPNLSICMKTKYLWSISKRQRFYRLCNTKTCFLKM